MGRQESLRLGIIATAAAIVVVAAGRSIISVSAENTESQRGPMASGQPKPALEREGGLFLAGPFATKPDAATAAPSTAAAAAAFAARPYICIMSKRMDIIEGWRARLAGARSALLANTVVERGRARVGWLWTDCLCAVPRLLLRDCRVALRARRVEWLATRGDRRDIKGRHVTRYSKPTPLFGELLRTWRAAK